MSKPPDWLPEALRYEDFKGDWKKFLDSVYAIFERDFKHSRPEYDGHPVTYDSKIEDGKEAAFWHITTSTDEVTHERLLAFRRCERIGWIKAIIAHPYDKYLKVWREKRKGGIRIHLWLEDFDYLVVLAERRSVMALVSAFYIDSERMRRKLRKRWTNFSG